MLIDDSIWMVLKERNFVMIIIKLGIISYILVILFIDFILNLLFFIKYCCIFYNYIFKLINVMDDI